MAAVQALYYTDPFCPWSWALEPMLRRLQWELGDGLHVTYVMSGMGSELEDPGQMAFQALEASEASGMPVDVRLWLRDPPRSSHPACIAVVAAAEQGDPAGYLRRLREAAMCRQRRLEAAEELTAEARATPDLKLERFKLDISSSAILERFASDLERARSASPQQQAEGSGRVRLPSLEFRGPGDEVHGVYGYSDYPAYAAAAQAAGARPDGGPTPSVSDALRRFGTMSATEVAAVCGLAGPAAAAELWRMATEFQVKPKRLGTAELWALA